MGSDPTPAIRVVLRLEKDSRLVHAVGGAVHFQTIQLGLDEQACSNFSKASEAFCRELMGIVPEAVDELQVIVDRFPDRVEASVEYRTPANFRRGFARDFSAHHYEKLAAHVDQVLSNTEDGVSRTTLVKFLNPKA